MQAVDAEIRSILETQYKRARKIIEDNADKMHAMARALLEWETIDGEQIDDILAGREPRAPKMPEGAPAARPGRTAEPAPEKAAASERAPAADGPDDSGADAGEAPAQPASGQPAESQPARARRTRRKAAAGAGEPAQAPGSEDGAGDGAAGSTHEDDGRQKQEPSADGPDKSQGGGA